MFGLLPAGVAGLARDPRGDDPRMYGMSPPPGPFIWGAGGARMTPQEIAAQRERAAQMGAVDTSPIGHWTQGAARVLNNVMGALDERSARKASEANAAENKAVIDALLNPEGGTDAIAAALVNPYISDEARKFAGMRWEQMQPKTPDPTEMQRNYDWLKSSLGQAQADQFLQGKIDPETVVSGPTGVFIGPRSQLGAAFGAQPEAQAPSPQAPQSAGGNFADVSGARRLIQSMGPKAFLSWQQQQGVPVLVNGPEEMAALPSGTVVMSRDGRRAVKK